MSAGATSDHGAQQKRQSEEFDLSAPISSSALLLAGGSRALRLFLAKLDPTCKHLWSKVFGDASLQEGKGVAIDASDNIFVAGDFFGSVDFGGGAPLVSNGNTDLFVVKLESNGNQAWSKSFGDPGWQETGGVTVDGAGNVTVTGRNDGTIDFGQGPVTSSGGYDVFVAKLDPNGAPVWSKTFGDGKAQAGYTLAADGNGALSILGLFSGTIDFGGGPLIASGNNCGPGDCESIFVAKLSP